MKRCNVFSIFILLQCSNFMLISAEIAPECISTDQLKRATVILCKNERDNKTLWNSVIECHRPISDEFMRSSAEALCPNPKHVRNPTDTRYSIEEVFFNICGLTDGNRLQKMEGGQCLQYGRFGIMSHEAEVKEVKKRWGEDAICKIGECVKQMGLDLGT